MKTLKLFGFTEGMRTAFVNGKIMTTSANAYVYHPDAKNPDISCDANGKPIGTFMNDETRLALEKHVREVIMPAVDKALMKTEYTVNDVDYTNMAPHPHLVMMRRDGRPLQKDDLQNMQKQLAAAINRINKPVSTETIFAKRSSRPNQDTQQHHYHLRSRK